jgi:hypothetical protein
VLWTLHQIFAAFHKTCPDLRILREFGPRPSERCAAKDKNPIKVWMGILDNPAIAAK